MILETSTAYRLLLSGLVSAMVAASPHLLSAEGILVRTMEDGRFWQTCLDPSAPLVWPWVIGAESAMLTVSNLTSETVMVATVMRDGDAAYGQFTMDIPQLPVERLFFVALEQSADDVVLQRDAARIAYIPGVGGGAITVRAAKASVWRQSEKVAVFAYDERWANGDISEALVSWTSGDGASGSRTLADTSGYGIHPLSGGTWTNLSLMFDGVSVASASLTPWHGGLLVVIR